MTRVILIEFNELCPRLLDAWMDAGHLPNFQRLLAQSEVFITEADETNPATLEPWIQWYSIHTGLPYSEHGVFRLTDGPRAGHPDIWSILHDYGKSVWNCASMNARGFAYPGSAYLPDAWCTTERAHPVELETFQRFVTQHVQEHTSPDAAVGLWGTAQFAGFMATHGLRFATMSAMMQQFASERANSSRTKWRRVSLLDKLQFDVFRYYFRQLRPDFSSFFVNSTAHLQHAYWRHMEPEAFVVQPEADDLSTYQNAILFGYQEMDLLVGEFLALAGSHTHLVFATALSQQPYTKYEAIGGHHFYRPRNVNALLASLDVVPEKILPVMTHQYLAHFADAVATERAKTILTRITLSGEPVFGFYKSQPGSLYFGSQIHTLVPPDSRIQLVDSSGRSLAFYEVFHRIEEIKSGRHHPDGCLWITTGTHRRHADKVSILDILPTIVAMFGLETDQFVGRPLLARTLEMVG
jgi:Type I phosphodiesterase / nucleotide pyrophosphatase